MIKPFSNTAAIGVFLAIAIVVAACGPGTPATGGSVPSDWPQANHDYANTRVATGTPISSANVRQLGVDWTFKVSGTGRFGVLGTSPIVVNHVVYLQDLNSNAYAIDLNSGKLVWQKLYNATNLGPNGAAYDNGMVFVSGEAHTVAALDAKTGTEVGPSRSLRRCSRSASSSRRTVAPSM
jgi:glucose dehydrogenase